MVKCTCGCALYCYYIEVDVSEEEYAEDEAAEQCSPDIVDYWECDCTCESEDDDG